MQPKVNSPELLGSKYDAWFSDFIAKLKVEQLKLETETASAADKKFFDTLITGNLDDVFKLHESARQQYFVRKIVAAYVQELKGQLPLKLAFNFNESEVLVWAEIQDGDEATEDRLLLAEAKINAEFYPGFTMNSMIVEASDHIKIPHHYESLIS